MEIQLSHSTNPAKLSISASSTCCDSDGFSGSSTITSINSSDTIECDYDVNPTPLYLSIQHKNWGEVCDIVKTYPDQIKTWVYRKEDDDTNSSRKDCLRWRLLPLHAAIIFKAPENIIQALLTAYPRACRYKDDQGMLPIHLALRTQCTEAVVIMLLLAFPQCTHIGDRKNRTPMHIAKKSTSDLQQSYINALHNFKLYYDVASASCNESTLYEEKNDPSSTTIGDHLAGQKLTLMGKVDSLEMEIAKTKDENQLLVDHVNSVNDKLNSTSESQSYLIQKISNLESKMKDVKQEKERMEVQYKRELTSSSRRMELLQEQIESHQEEIEIYKQINDEKNKSLDIAHETSMMNSDEWDKLEDRIKTLEIENATLLANSAVLETQLRQKIQNEHLLASQISDMASKLSESALMCSELTNTHQKRIQTFQRDKMGLKHSYNILAHKLQDALETMNEMTRENNRMIKLSSRQEKIISDMYKQQEELAEHAHRHEQTLLEAAWEREEIVRILTRQAKEFQNSNKERKMLMKVVKENNFQIASSAEERSQLFSSFSKQKGLMESLKEEVNDLYQTVNNEVDGISLDSDKENEVVRCRASQGGRSVLSSRAKLQFSQHKEKSDSKPAIETFVAADASGSVELLPNTSTLSLDSFDDIDDSSDHDATLGEIPMNVGRSSLAMKNKSMDDLESSVDNLCKEAAALIASIPSSSRNSIA